MAPCENPSLNPKGKGYDSKVNIHGSSEDLYGRCRSITDEKYALYCEQIAESDGFDVQVFPEGDGEDDAICGLIVPYSLTTAGIIELCNEAVQFATEYANCTQGRTLQPVRAIKYMAQAAGPLNHYITFSATDNSTGVTEVYQALVYQYIPWERSEVAIFRKKAVQQVDEADLVQHLAIFAVYHYNKTEKGDDLKYINVTSFERLESSYSISFWAKSMLTGDVQIYQTEIVYRDPMQNSLVKTFRKSRIQWTNQDEEFRFFAIFAVHHYNETKGEQLELIQVTTCHQSAESYYIAFKARDLSTCMVEHYETEVVSTAPEYNSMVKMFKKLSTNQALQEIQGANISTCHKMKGIFSASKSKQPGSGPSTSQKNDALQGIQGANISTCHKMKASKSKQPGSGPSTSQKNDALQEIQGANISTCHKMKASKSKQPCSGPSTSQKNDALQEIQGANISTCHIKKASKSKQPGSGPSTSKKNDEGKKATGSTKKHNKRK